MIKKIKKHLNKILIACITLISSIAIFTSINKTYAYTSDRLSYTIDSVSNRNDTIRNPITIDNKTGYLYSIADYNNYYIFGLDLNSTTQQNINFIDCYIMFNYYISDGTTIYDYDNQNAYITIRYFIDSNGNNNYISLPQLKSLQSIYNITNNNMYTYIAKITIGQNVYNNKLYINFSNYNYGILITNIDIVTPSDIGLHQYYETYYSQIEDNYNQLQSDYNDLQDNYDTLQTNYDTLEDNYNDLETDYTNLQNNYNNLEDRSKYGWLRYIDNLDLNVGGNEVTSYSFEQLRTNNFITFNSLNVYDLSLQSNPNYTYSTIDIYFADSINNTDYFSYNLFSLTSNNECNSRISIIDTDNNISIFEYSSQLAIINPSDIIEKNSNFNGNIYNIKIYNSSPDSAVNFFINSDYNLGYQYGYDNGSRTRDNYYEPQINTLNDNINSLNQQVTSQQLLINSLQDTISAQEDGVTLNSLIWTIAGTPFESFKQIWNVDFLGVNISGLLTGFFTALIVLFVVKKFFL